MRSEECGEREEGEKKKESNLKTWNIES